MAMIRQQALDLLFRYNQDGWRVISGDPSIPQTVKTMTYQHYVGLWIPDFLAVVISPLREGLNTYLWREGLQWEGVTWYVPSINFWKAHADVSHPPAGQGCDANAHATYLTRSGEFLYANVLRNGAIQIEDLDG